MFKALLAAITALGVTTASGGTAERLVLGSVNDNVRKHVERMTPMAEFFETELAGMGITSVEISVLPTSTDMIQAMRDGEVHLYFDSPLVATLVADGANGTPLLRRWKRGVGEYHSLIIVPTQSDIETLDDLAGNTIGFQDPDSTSGFMLPAGLVLARGLELVEVGPSTPHLSSTQVGYVFTDDDKNTILWLARGRLDAAATDPRGFVALETAQPGKYRVLARSVDVPRQVVVGGPALSLQVTKRIKTLLTGLSKTDRGVDVLESFHDTTGFDEFPLGVAATFNPIRDLLEDLRAQHLIN